MAFTQDWSPMEVPTTPDEKRRQLDDDYRNDDELDRDRLLRAESPDPEDDDDLDEDDLDDDDLDLDDDDDLDDDIVPDYDEDLDDDDDLDEDDDDLNRITGQASPTLSSGIVSSYDNDEPDEMPEQEEADNEDLRYPSEEEVRPVQGDDASFSEQTDVTPPKEREMPSLGNAPTSFESRTQGRTTGRMIGHEPGTEGI